MSTLLLFSLLALFTIKAPAQILWRHTTADAWINPITHKEDSAVCFTAVSCQENNCTAVGTKEKSTSTVLVVYRSNDGGKTWLEQPQQVGYKPQVTNRAIKKVQQIDSLNVVAMAWEHGCIFRTTDGGATWFNIDCPVDRDMWDIHFSNPMTGIITCAGPDSNLFTTTDGGITWEKRLSTWYAACHSDGNGKYSVFKYAHGPIYTTQDFITFDSTRSLFDTVSDPTFRYVFAWVDFGDADGLMFAMGNYFSLDTASGQTQANGLIMRSTNGGQSWEQPWVFPWTKLNFIRHITDTDRDTLYAGGGDARFHVFSSDRGASWRLDSNLIDTSYETARCHGMTMAGDGHPVASFSSPGLPHASLLTRGEYTSARVEYIEVIKSYTHFFPNPTTGLINIETRYSLPVIVVDIFGREIIKGEHLSREGKLAIDLSGYPAGIYNVIFDWMGRKFIAGKIAVTR